jgi:hypothetical protein
MGIHRQALASLGMLLLACSDGGAGRWDADADAEGDTHVDATGDVGTDVPVEPATDPVVDAPADTPIDAAPDAAHEPDGGSGTDGCVPTDTPGCGGCPCETCVCDIEPHCCEWFWDEACVWDCEHLCGQEC